MTPNYVCLIYCAFSVCFIPYSYFAIVHDSRGCVGTYGRVRARSPTHRRAAIRRAILLYPFRTLEIRIPLFKPGYRMYLASRVCLPASRTRQTVHVFVLILLFARSARLFVPTPTLAPIQTRDRCSTAKSSLPGTGPKLSTTNRERRRTDVPTNSRDRSTNPATERR